MTKVLTDEMAAVLQMLQKHAAEDHPEVADKLKEAGDAYIDLAKEKLGCSCPVVLTCFFAITFLSAIKALDIQVGFFEKKN